MLRLLVFLAFIIALASGLAWLADRPGLIVVNWEGYQAEISVFHAVVALAFLTGLVLVIWSVLRHLWESPAAIGGYFKRQRQKRGLDALSTGMIAIGAGDRATATKYAIQARKSMPNEPLTHLLRAQAAQLSGDKGTARRIYESMLASPDTEQLGLRGLFLEAEREGEFEAAKQFAERAVRLNPQLSWPVDALFDLQCKGHDWVGALDTLAVARKNGHVEKASAERRRAVLLTAQAQDLEDKDPERALNLSLDAHKLAPGLVPAAAIAGRLLASRGATPKATKLLQKTWQKSPHPDLATAFAYARLGDSPRDRLDRVRKLAQLNPHSLESAIALANAAIEAKDYTAARKALEPLKEGRLTQRACTLMARIEGEEHGDKGAVREWLARAVNAPRDPAWTADGVISEHWSAVSPVTGALDAFQWRVPVESMEKTADEIVARKLEELVALGAPVDAAVAARDVTPESAAGNSIVETDSIEDAIAPSAGPTPARPPAADIADADAVTVRPGTTAAKTVAGTGTAASSSRAGRSANAAADAGTPGEQAKALPPLDTLDRERQPSAAQSEPVSAEATAQALGDTSKPTAAQERSMRAAAAVRQPKVSDEPDGTAAESAPADSSRKAPTVTPAPAKPVSSEQPASESASADPDKGAQSGRTPAASTASVSPASSPGTETPPKGQDKEKASAAAPSASESATSTGSDQKADAPERSAATSRPSKETDTRSRSGQDDDDSGPKGFTSGSGDRDTAGQSGGKPGSASLKAGSSTDAAGIRQEASDRNRAGQTSARAVSEARIFVSPRAPDDPGPDDSTEAEVPQALKPYRVHS